MMVLNLDVIGDAQMVVKALAVGRVRMVVQTVALVHALGHVKVVVWDIAKVHALEVVVDIHIKYLKGCLYLSNT